MTNRSAGPPVAWHDRALTIAELERLVRDAARNFDVMDVLHEIAGRVHVSTHAFGAIRHSISYAWYAHTKFLPAANAYRRMLRLAAQQGSKPPDAQRIVARLGGTSRQLYAMQRKTFMDLLDLVGDVVAIPERIGSHEAMREHLWHVFKNAERRWLSKARAKA